MPKVNLDTATRLDIVCRKGDSFLLELDFGKEMPASNVPDGLNGLYEFKVKASTTSDAAVTGGFAVNVTNSADGETNHVVRIEASSDDMTSFGSEPATDVEPGLYVYDLQVTDRGSAVVDPTYIYDPVDGANRTVTLLYGTFKIVDDVNA